MIALNYKISCFYFIEEEIHCFTPNRNELQIPIISWRICLQQNIQLYYTESRKEKDAIDVRGGREGQWLRLGYGEHHIYFRSNSSLVYIVEY